MLKSAVLRTRGDLLSGATGLAKSVDGRGIHTFAGGDSAAVMTLLMMGIRNLHQVASSAQLLRYSDLSLTTVDE